MENPQGSNENPPPDNRNDIKKTNKPRAPQLLRANSDEIKYLNVSPQLAQNHKNRNRKSQITFAHFDRQKINQSNKITTLTKNLQTVTNSQKHKTNAPMRRKQTPNRKVIKNTTTDLSSSDRQSVNKMKGNNLGEKNILTDANNSMNLNISHVGSQQTKNVTKTGVKSSQIDDIPIPADVSAINSLNKEVNSQISNTTLQSIILEETTLPNNIKITDEKLDLNKLITITEEAPDAIHTTTVQNETLMSENAGEAQATEIPTEELGETTTYNMSNDEMSSGFTTLEPTSSTESPATRVSTESEEPTTLVPDVTSKLRNDEELGSPNTETTTTETAETYPTEELLFDKEGQRLPFTPTETEFAIPVAVLFDNTPTQANSTV